MTGTFLRWPIRFKRIRLFNRNGEGLGKFNGWGKKKTELKGKEERKRVGRNMLMRQNMVFKDFMIARVKENGEKRIIRKNYTFLTKKTINFTWYPGWVLTTFLPFPSNSKALDERGTATSNSKMHQQNSLFSIMKLCKIIKHKKMSESKVLSLKITTFLLQNFDAHLIMNVI